MRHFLWPLLLGVSLSTHPTTSHAGTEEILPPDVAQSCILNSDDFDENWLKLRFHDTPGNPLSGQEIGPFFDIDSGIVYIFPSDGPGFSEDAYGQSENCAFFNWAGHMFYWLTSSIDDGKMGVQPKEVTGLTPTAKLVFNGEWFYQLVHGKDGLELIRSADAVPPGSRFRPRTAKGDADAIGQAGTNGVLFTQADSSASTDSSMVYYSVHANRAYGYLRDAVQNDNPFFQFDEFPDTNDDACRALYYGLLNGFVDIQTEYGLLSLIMIDSYCPLSLLQQFAVELETFLQSELEALEREFPIIKEILAFLEKKNPYSVGNLGKIENLIPFVEPAVDFLAMSTEVKASWVLSSSLKDPSSYIQHRALIPVFGPPDATGKQVQTGVEEADLALVGMHIVGSVKGHPEMVWATVEHFNTAPSAPYHYVTNGQSDGQWSDLEARPGRSWLLSDGTDQAPNTEFARFDGGDGGDPAIVPLQPGQAQPVDTASNVLRLSPWGSPADASSAAINSELISFNASLYATMSTYYDNPAVQDPRINYVVTGVSWGKDGAFPTRDDTSMINGTPAMANTTMETFTQTFKGEVSPNGCFGCHGIDAGAQHFDVSHIFNRIVAVER